MQKIAVIGLGNIAQKAYLPIFAALQARYRFILSSRSIYKAEQIRAQYNFFAAVEGIDELIKSGAKLAFVHSATDQHFDICKRLLAAHMHVFVDKPISEKLEEVAELQRLAAANGAILMAGFNRRFAPKIQELKALPNKSMIIVSKNRINTKLATDFALYDDFIHPLDTALYLTDEAIEGINSKLIQEDGCLKRVIVTLDTASATLMISMNMQAGANAESVTVHSPSDCCTVDNLATLTRLNPNGSSIESFPDWTSTLEKRGFVPMVQAFLTATAIADTHGYAEAMAHCQQQNVYQSHKIIQDLLAAK